MKNIVRIVPVVNAWYIAEKAARRHNLETLEVYNLYINRFKGSDNLVSDHIPESKDILSLEYNAVLREFYQCIMEITDICWGDEFIAELD